MGTFRNQSSNLFYRGCNVKLVVAGQKLVLRRTLEAFLPVFPPPMNLDLDSRRSIRKISRADFAGYPVWEWALHEEETLGQDESFVRPTSLDCIPAEQARHYIVSATATLSEGTILPACVEVTVRKGKVTVAPLFLFLQDRQLPFGGADVVNTLSLLTKVAETRAVRWELTVPLSGQGTPLSGSVRSGWLARLARLLRRPALPSALSRV
jgi:hypothetical protein